MLNKNKIFNEDLANKHDLSNVKQQRIPVIEEQLTIGKKILETGKLKITKKVNSVQQTVDIPVVEEEVDVKRIAINEYIETPPPAVRQEDGKTIISILKEVLVVEKRMILVEEIHIVRKLNHTITTQQETLRQEEVHIDRIASHNNK